MIKVVLDTNIWIAATALLADATLVSTERDFEHLHKAFLNLIQV